MSSNVCHSDVWVPTVIIPVSLFFTAGTDWWIFHTVHKPSWQPITQFCQVHEVCQDAAHSPDQIPEQCKPLHYTPSPQGGVFHRKLTEPEKKLNLCLLLFQIKGEVRHTLSCCLDSNETFLKKSLQAALKRISASWRRQHKTTMCCCWIVFLRIFVLVQYISKMDFITLYCAGDPHKNLYMYILYI